MIWLYGGAWDWGNKDRSNPMVALIERGYAVSGVTYTKSREFARKVKKGLTRR